MQINWPQQRCRIAAEQLAATARKRIFYIYIEQCSNVRTGVMYQGKSRTSFIHEKTITNIK